jgi:hypothetical protein
MICMLLPAKVCIKVYFVCFWWSNIKKKSYISSSYAYTCIHFYVHIHIYIHTYIQASNPRSLLRQKPTTKLVEKAEVLGQVEICMYIMYAFLTYIHDKVMHVCMGIRSAFCPHMYVHMQVNVCMHYVVLWLLYAHACTCLYVDALVCACASLLPPY